MKQSVSFPGSVQMPVFRPGKVIVISNMDSWARVDVPVNHAVMISFPGHELASPVLRKKGQDCFIKLYAGGNSSSHMLWEWCGVRYSGYEEPFTPSLLHTDVLWLHAYSRQIPTRMGFRMLFSFHNRSSLPQRLPDGTWNCSVPHWSDFRQHLPCDLQAQCAGREDEAECPFVSEECGERQYSLGGQCYLYVIPDQPTTMLDAASQCRRHGGHLVSPHTPQKWNDLMELLSWGSYTLHYLGLRNSVPTLPEM